MRTLPTVHDADGNEIKALDTWRCFVPHLWDTYPNRSQWVSLIEKSEGGVYFIAGGGLVKIGTSTNVDRRLYSLRASSPVPLNLVRWLPRGGAWLEGLLHRFFAEHRSHGEWFTLPGKWPHQLDALLCILGFMSNGEFRWRTGWPGMVIDE